ncbi:MAG: Na/Pi cotransporter family protein, partial [Fibrobacterota bacterium]
MVLAAFELLGSLAVFLYGMKIMSESIQRVAGDKLRNILSYMTTNRFAGIFTGFAITSIIQSSSATTVMLVSFVNAGLLNLTQSIGVIMGANLGTTITGWIVSIFGFKFKISAIALPVAGIGLPLIFSKSDRRKDQGEILIGFGLLFLGLNFLKHAVPDIKSNPEVLSFLADYTNLGFFSYIIFLIAGVLLTITVQSSSAAMAVTITMAYKGWIDFPTAAAVVLGENIGTTITAYLASLGTSLSARRAARAHLVFNLLGVIWMTFLFVPFCGMIEHIVPGSAENTANIPIHLSMFHTMFNLANTFLLVGFVKQIAAIVVKIVPSSEGDDEEQEYKLDYLSSSLSHTPEIALMEIRGEIQKMSHKTEKMFGKFLDVFLNPSKKMGDTVSSLKKTEILTDRMQEEISGYILKCTKEHLSDESAENVNFMLRIVNELESIGDSCYNLVLICQRRYEKKMTVNEDSVREIVKFAQLIKDFLKLNSSHIAGRLSAMEMEEAYRLES